MRIGYWLHQSRTPRDLAKGIADGGKHLRGRLTHHAGALLDTETRICASSSSPCSTGPSHKATCIPPSPAGVRHVPRYTSKPRQHGVFTVMGLYCIFTQVSMFGNICPRTYDLSGCGNNNVSVAIVRDAASQRAGCRAFPTPLNQAAGSSVSDGKHHEVLSLTGVSVRPKESHR